MERRRDWIIGVRLGCLVIHLAWSCEQTGAIWFQAVFSRTTDQERQSCLHPPWWLPSIQIRIERFVGYKCYTTSTLLE